MTKKGNLSAKALKRKFKDGGVQKKSAKKQRMLKAKPDEVFDEPPTEIPHLNFPRTSEEEFEKRRRLNEAVENYFESGATAKELLAALSDANIKRAMKIMEENRAAGMHQPPPSPI